MPETVSIAPAPIPVERMIDFYFTLNPRGQAEFILTIKEKDRQPFLDALEKHWNNLGKTNKHKNKPNPNYPFGDPKDYDPEFPLTRLHHSLVYHMRFVFMITMPRLESVKAQCKGSQTPGEFD